MVTHTSTLHFAKLVLILGIFTNKYRFQCWGYWIFTAAGSKKVFFEDFIPLLKNSQENLPRPSNPSCLFQKKIIVKGSKIHQSLNRAGFFAYFLDLGKFLVQFSNKNM